MTGVVWSDEPWCDECSTWKEGDGRYGCLASLAIVCLVAWMLVAIAVG